MGSKKNKEAFRFTLNKLRAKIKLVNQRVPVVVARTVENHFKANFEKQGFDDSAVDPWKEVKRRIPGTKAYKYAKAYARTRAILVGSGSGRMKRDIKVTRATEKEVRVSMSLLYAKYHNEGIGVPKRKMIGKSSKLNSKIKEEIAAIIRSAFR